jgi:hypothetical protein
MQGRMFSEGSACKHVQERVKAVRLQAELVMAGLIRKLSISVAKNPHLLTHAVRCVFSKAASEMQWEPCRCSDDADDPLATGCWVAESNEGCKSTTGQGEGAGTATDVYTVNLMTGAALCNGQRPDTLPDPILQREVYRSIFLSMEFEITSKVINGQRTYSTRHTIDGYNYSWRLDSSGSLHITETCNEDALELLPCAPAFHCSSFSRLFACYFVSSQ